MLEHLGDAVIVTGDPGVIHEGTNRAKRDIQALAVDVREEDLAGPPVASHDRLPAADGTRSEDDDGIAQTDVEDFDAVKGAGKRVRDGRQVGRQVRGKRDDVFHRDRRNRRVVRIGAGVRIVAVQQVLVTEVLETFRAPPAHPARQDRAEKNSIALLDSGW